MVVPSDVSLSGVATWVLLTATTFWQYFFGALGPRPYAMDVASTTQSFRLPATLHPTHYDLTIFSDLERLKFQGTVNVSLDVVHSTRHVEFNAGANLDLSQACVYWEGAQHCAAPVVDTRQERARISIDTKLPKGAQVYMAIGFRGDIDDSMKGYYRSTWEHNGHKANYAFTQFAPISARRAFPSWDEPDLKATYQMRVIHRRTTTALANMPVLRERPLDRHGVRKALGVDALRFTEVRLGHAAWVETEFEVTPKMSTYLVVWADGEFRHLSGSYTSPLTGRVVPLRVYATPEYIHQAAYALEVKEKILPVYERLFSIAYPLPKLDTLVVADFDANAMENWGLITGRTAGFLYDAKSGLAGKKSTASLASHEVAHMWFGDIATMAWWDGLWLNEAFATFMGEVIIMGRVFPEWNSARGFVAGHLRGAMELDAKRSSHPIEMPMEGDSLENAIYQVFDEISYSKGASVLRMLSQMLGEETFLDGVSRYLQKHLYGNTVTRDLWDGISEASGRDVDAIMSAWVQQPGFPVLTVRETDEGLYVRQNRFLSTGDVRPDEDETLWHVPLALRTFTAHNTTTHYDLMLSGERETFVPLPRATHATWKLNADALGVYRVSYTAEHLRRLSDVAAQPHTPLSHEDRAGLLGDAWVLAQATYNRTSSALSLSMALHGQQSALINQVLAANVAKLASVWWEQPGAVRGAIDAFALGLFGPAARALSFDVDDGDSIDTRNMRVTALRMAAAAGDSWALREIDTRFAALRDADDDRHIHPDLFGIVLSEAVRRGGASAYDVALRIYEHPATPDHKEAAMAALSNVREKRLVQRTLDLVFSPRVKTQDLGSFFRALSENPASRRPFWVRFQAEFANVSQRLGGSFSLAKLIRASASSFTSEEDAKDIERFFATQDTAVFSMSLAQTLESVRARAQWVARDAKDVASWLTDHGYLV